MDIFLIALNLVSGLLGWFMWGYLLPATLKAYKELQIHSRLVK